MKCAYNWAEMSYCKRKQVGSVLAKDGRIIATGYNGTISDSNNCCEELINGELVSSEFVVHAEQNVISFTAKMD